ncbi:hypothetical protein NTGHW29_620011 [Candidatus Nitrotoga sp. HW29]|nr:hypothetical protein NTGHW29_620011 [Candidatus Nitrotoga sp. HW29]
MTKRLTPLKNFMFQSSPAPKSGRYAALFKRWEKHPEVSILARPEERALPMQPAKAANSYWFQSSPAPKSGRYWTLWREIGTLASFNPRPPRRAGATR